VIVLSIKNEEKLHSVLNKLKENNINHACFREPDIGNALTSIACEPVCSDEQRRFFRKYQLIKEHKYE
jgi:hypothetical protein